MWNVVVTDYLTLCRCCCVEQKFLKALHDLTPGHIVSRAVIHELDRSRSHSHQYVDTVYIRFLARDSMLSALYAIANPSVCPSVRLSVCLSVTRVDQSKMVERIIEILSPSDRPNILVF